MEYYSVKKKEVIMHTLSCMDLKATLFSKKSQSQKFTYSVIPSTV